LQKVLADPHATRSHQLPFPNLIGGLDLKTAKGEVGILVKKLFKQFIHSSRSDHSNDQQGND
jgi:hypothetical protein